MNLATSPETSLVFYEWLMIIADEVLCELCPQQSCFLRLSTKSWNLRRFKSNKNSNEKFICTTQNLLDFFVSWFSHTKCWFIDWNVVYLYKMLSSMRSMHLTSINTNWWWWLNIKYDMPIWGTSRIFCDNLRDSVRLFWEQRVPVWSLKLDFELSRSITQFGTL